MKRRTLASLALLAATAAGAQAETITIGVPPRPATQVTANIIAEVLRANAGADVAIEERGTMTVLGDIAGGAAEVHPEVWFPSLQDMAARLSAPGGPLELSPVQIGASQNICVTRQTAETTGIRKLADLANPEIAARFDSNGDGKGELWIGAPLWWSTVIEKVRARSYGYDKTMTLLEIPEDVAMAGVDAAVSLGKPIVFYCYGPHHVFKLHDVVKLEEPEYDPSKWHLVAPADDPDWLEKSTAGTAWAPSSIRIGFASRLVDDAPEVARLLSSISIESDELSWMSYAVLVEGKSPEKVADEWMAGHRNIVAGWLK